MFLEASRPLTSNMYHCLYVQALNANGIFFKKYELQVFEKAFGKSGQVDWFAFLSHLKEPMGPLRRELVEHIFDSMDQNKKGSLTVSQLRKIVVMKWSISMQMRSRPIDWARDPSKRPKMTSFLCFLSPMER